MKNSAIQWCDHTFNAWEGCTKVAPECKNCYAETLVDHRFGRAKWGPGRPRRRTSANLWKQPLAWNREAQAFNRRDRVFCLSLGDWLDEEVPIEWLRNLIALIHTTPHLDWLLLTKRPQNWRRRMQAVLDIEENETETKNGIIETGGEPGWALKLFFWLGNSGVKVEPFANVWIGVSAGAEIEAALEIPAIIHFLSCEPMLKPLDDKIAALKHFDWIIFGGESGRNARPCELQWIDDGIDFCSQNGIACFVKQFGRIPLPRRFPTTGEPYQYETLKITDSHGGDWDEWPVGDVRFRDLRHREFPVVRVINKLVPLDK